MTISILHLFGFDVAIVLTLNYVSKNANGDWVPSVVSEHQEIGLGVERIPPTLHSKIEHIDLIQQFTFLSTLVIHWK